MKVFISYSNTDYDVAKRIYDDLSRENISSWIDTEDLLLGQNRKNTIRHEIENLTHFWLCYLQILYLKKAISKKN